MSALVAEGKQSRQAFSRTSALQEVMADKLICRSPALDIHAQTDAQERLQLLGQLFRLLEAGRAVRSDQVKCLERFFVQVWRFGLDHLDCHDAERPDVDLAAVFFLLDDFGRHPVGCADHGCALVALFSELGAEAKISCSCISNAVFNVSVGSSLLILTFPRASRRTLSDLMSL